MENIKLVVVGDGTVGKTSLLISYTENRFPIDYVPTGMYFVAASLLISYLPYVVVFDNFTAGVEVDGRLISFALWDTAGQEEYAKLRTLSYPETDIFLLCFAINSHASFENIVTKWNTEVTHYCPKAIKLLVGTKKDLRPKTQASSPGFQELNPKFVTSEMGAKMATEIGAAMYLECSALTQEGLNAVFENAIRSVPSPMMLAQKKKGQDKKKKNCILF